MRHLALPLAIVCAAPAFAAGDEAPVVTLPEVEVTATRREGPSFESPRAGSIIGEREIGERQARTAPEALREAPGVMVQQTAYGQGSPFIRGLTGNQTLILIDGVRLNNSTFRFGANQYLATVDPFTIERIEIVRGPSSVLYGSDALGGVVHVFTRAPEETGGALIGRYGSAAKERTGRIEGSAYFEGLGAIGGYTYSDFDDLRGGRHTGVQDFTAYRAEAADAKAVWRADRHEVTLAYQHVRQHEVPRTDRLTLEPIRNLKLIFEPQQRDLAYVAYAFEDPDLLVTGVRSNVSFHRQLEGREEIRVGRPEVETRDRDWIETWGTSHQVELAEVFRNRLTAGVEYYRDHVASRRVDVNFATGTTTTRRPRFADGGIYQTLGVFVQDEIAVVPEHLKVVLGGRYTRIEIDGEFADPQTGAVSLDRTLDALTGSAHLWWSPIDELALFGGVSQGFRAPNFDDLSIFGQGGGGFEIPNPDADPEHAIAYEAGLRFRAPGDEPIVTGSVTGFWTEFDDLLQREQGEFEGLPFIDTDGDGVQDPGESTVLQRKNVGRARIFGVETELRVRLPREVSLGGERWTVFGHFTWTYGENREDDEPVRGIPPAQGLAGVRCDWEGGKYFVEGVGRFARDQDRLAAADATDPRFPEGGTPGYEAYDIRGGARFRLFRSIDRDANAELTVGVENILDRDYRVHGSGVNGAGTNFVATLGVKF